MNLFYWGKKISARQQEKSLIQEKQMQLWRDAYQVSPKVYEKEDGTLLVGFAVTEDCDLLFPMTPEEQWTIKDTTW